jgi:hypothetical protein
MKKRTKTTKALDAKHFGQEPDLRGNIDRIDIIKAYNWYSYNCDSDQAKTWIIEYLKEFYKTEKELIKNVSRIDSNYCRTSGWNCRILLLGGALPQELAERNLERIRALARKASRDEVVQEEGSAKEEVKQVISIQERVTNRANDLIADLEVQLDNYYRDGSTFKPSDWLSQQDVKPAIAQRIADYYKPLYSEVYDALNGKDTQLKEGYSRWSKPKLKAYVEFIKSIISAAETRATIAKATRKPRKKKEKSPVQLVAKLKYKVKDDEYKFVSVDPKQIIGANQLWVFNTKYRTLAVYNAMGPAGLNVKGSTVIGFDEKTSIVKKLRKPTEQVNKLLDGGKVVLRKFMDEIKCKPKTANGRINNEIILLRIIK